MSAYNRIPFPKKEIRAGLSTLSIFISKGIRPFLLGYSALHEEVWDHRFEKLSNCPKHGTQIGHDPWAEIDLLNKLHTLKLIDLSFCLINIPKHKWPFKPTEEAKLLWNFNPYKIRHVNDI